MLVKVKEYKTVYHTGRFYRKQLRELEYKESVLAYNYNDKLKELEKRKKELEYNYSYKLKQLKLKEEKIKALL